MRIIVIGVVLATVMASPLSAQPQATKQQWYSAYGQSNGPARKPLPPTLFPATTPEGLCSTAPGFCPGYHGSNG